MANNPDIVVVERYFVSAIVNCDFVLLCKCNIYWLSVLGEGPLLCGSSWSVFHLFFFLNIERIKGIRTEDVVLCTDYKDHWGDVIRIVGYINKIDLKKNVFWRQWWYCCNPKRQQHPEEGTQGAWEMLRPERIVHIVTCIYIYIYIHI